MLLESPTAATASAPKKAYNDLVNKVKAHLEHRFQTYRYRQSQDFFRVTAWIDFRLCLGRAASRTLF
jgi:hypothetical protein